MRKNLLLLALALLVSILLAEVALRAFLPGLGRPYNSLYLTTEVPRSDQFGAIYYPPHRAGRLVLMYGDEIEVNARYQTNDMGAFDPVDYLPAARSGTRFLFVGDSYAAGLEGERRWIPALREAHGIEAYAFGMGATGIPGFERTVNSASRILNFTDLVYVAISDDFYRTVWWPLARADGLWFCPDRETEQDCMRQRPPIAYPMRYDSTEADLVARSREIHADAARNRNPLGRLLWQSRVLLLASSVVLNHIGDIRRRPVLAESIASLQRVKLAHPGARIRFVHVPDRYETARGKYSLDVAELLKGTGIEYLPVLGTCPWTMDLYLPRDNHPNTTGYDALGRCVAGMLGLQAVAPKG